jgi:CCR4-NOT transcription complex subunit 7/8
MGARYVAVDVHYPGIVHHPGKDHNALTPEQRYALVKANVGALKPLQVGIAVCDSQGRIQSWGSSTSAISAVTPTRTT